MFIRREIPFWQTRAVDTKEYNQRVRICILIILLSIGLFTGCAPRSFVPDGRSSATVAYEQRKSDFPVEDEGVVSRILPDDTSGSPHQRFIVRLASGQTVLIEHNTAIAPRISEIAEGDPVSFFGEYVWNAQGGIVHWTHHDPDGRHVAGWLKHKGRTYQ